MKRIPQPSLLLALLTFLSRLPYLFAGYGREEDAWSQALNARTIAETGVYEVSRLPGHPVYELLLAALWPIEHSYFFFNFLSSLVSVFSVLIFYKIALQHCPKYSFRLALTFAFIPVFFIAGTYTIDYNFALLFILLSYYALINDKLIWSGVWLGVACGIRISSLFMILPWLLIMKGWHWKNLLKLSIPAGMVAFVCYLPPLITYGTHFLDFHKPPYPSLSNILYKLSFGIWGVPLLLYLLFVTFFNLLSRKVSSPPPYKNTFSLAVFLIILLQLLVFLRLPFKAEFFIPAIPFVLLALALLLRKWQIHLLPYMAVISCFSLGIDYHDDYRGNKPSPLSVSFDAGNKELFLDLIKGPVTLDNGKRKTKMQYVSRIMESLEKKPNPVYLISGWYWPQLMMRWQEKDKVVMDYFSEKAELQSASGKGFEIYYLQEINEANARVYGHYEADSLGTLLPLP